MCTFLCKIFCALCQMNILQRTSSKAITLNTFTPFEWVQTVKVFKNDTRSYQNGDNLSLILECVCMMLGRAMTHMHAWLPIPGYAGVCKYIPPIPRTDSYISGNLSWKNNLLFSSLMKQYFSESSQWRQTNVWPVMRNVFPCQFLTMVFPIKANFFFFSVSSSKSQYHGS